MMILEAELRWIYVYPQSWLKKSIPSFVVLIDSVELISFRLAVKGNVKISINCLIYPCTFIENNIQLEKRDRKSQIVFSDLFKSDEIRHHHYYD